METIKQKECKINSSDLWIIGGCTMLGLAARFFVLQASAMAFVGCLMVGIGFGLVISSLIAKKKMLNRLNNYVCRYQAYFCKMKIKEILKYAEKPELYEKGTAVMWTDPHISKQLLEVHLNPEIDLATRKKSTVQHTAEWVLKQAKQEQMNILDLGCGPGIYTEIFAKNGHKVTGVDFSKNSIDYASGEAKKKGLDINYLNQNYLELDVPENHFDVVTLIFTDLGVLNPDDRDRLIQHIKNTLKPGGLFIFDLLNDKNLESKVSPKHWEVQEKGFWKDAPYLALSESILYKEEKVILSQHTVMDENDEMKVYRFWTHFFAQEDIKAMLQKHGFNEITFHKDVLPEIDIWNGDNVTFTVTLKNL